MNLTQSSKKSVFISVYLANMVSSYNFFITASLLVYMHPYFDVNNSFWFYIVINLAFFTNWIMCPLGALFFGYIGDTYGRKPALLISIFGMSASMLFLSILPNSHSILVLAPILLTLLRGFQGFCWGGQSGSNVFVLEHFKNYKPGFINACLMTSYGIGTLLSYLVGLYFLSSPVSEGQWRLCYFVGAFLGFIGFYIQYYIPDTATFLKEKHNKASFSLLKIWQTRKYSIIAIVLCVGFEASITYFQKPYISKFLLWKNLDMSSTIIFASLSAFGTLICCVAAGFACDRKGLHFVLNSIIIFSLLCIFPLYYLISIEIWTIIIVNFVVLYIIIGSLLGTISYFVIRLFPVSQRYTAVTFLVVSANALWHLFKTYLPKYNTYLYDTSPSQTMTVPLFPVCCVFIMGLFLLIFLSQYRQKMTFFDDK